MKEKIEKLITEHAIGQGSISHEGPTPDGIRHFLEADKRGYNEPLAHGNGAQEIKSPERARSMVEDVKSMIITKNRVMDR